MRLNGFKLLKSVRTQKKDRVLDMTYSVFELIRAHGKVTERIYESQGIKTKIKKKVNLVSLPEDVPLRWRLKRKICRGNRCTNRQRVVVVLTINLVY